MLLDNLAFLHTIIQLTTKASWGWLCYMVKLFFVFDIRREKSKPAVTRLRHFLQL